MDIVDRILKNINGVTTVAALERTLGFGNGIIKKWKTQSPSCEKISKIADYLNVSVDYLLGRTENPQSHISTDDCEISTIFNSLNHEARQKVIAYANDLSGNIKYTEPVKLYAAAMGGTEPITLEVKDKAEVKAAIEELKRKQNRK